ncbi:MAG: tRNA1(Val) (adenine(37)-N6)-methyltransferase [Crocinitomicaceae bacterium]
MAFQFKQFAIKQTENQHKVGTDSMVLGAWVSKKFEKGLDIGTGTGILALMIAQENLGAKITAIEPNEDSCNEAKLNFKNSPFSDRIVCIHSRLQDFESANLFDFIICNPPYFVGSTLSRTNTKNKARHTIDLTIDDLYFHVSRLLTTDGNCNVIFPADLLSTHLLASKNNDLFPTEILIIENENKKAIRHLIKFSKKILPSKKSSMIVKYGSGVYSKQYVNLTKNFHSKTLHFKA